MTRARHGARGLHFPSFGELGEPPFPNECERKLVMRLTRDVASSRR